MAVSPYGRPLLFNNNAQTTLAGSISNTDTTINLQSGGGAQFGSIPVGSGIPCTITDASTGLLREIVLVTGRSGDTVTVIRAQEGTTGLNWSANDLFAQLVTAGGLATMVQLSGMQVQPTNYGVDTGAANAYIVAFTPAITSLGGSYEGTQLRVAILNTNTAASVINYGAGSVPITRRDGTALIGNELAAGQVAIFTILDDGSLQLQGLQPATDAAVAAGTDTQSAVTPAQLANASSAPTGSLQAFAGITLPTGWLWANGAAISRVTYATLFNILTKSATVTISIASPGVVSWTGHGLSVGAQVYFETTGALPTGLIVGTPYYIISAGFGANAFQVSTTPGGAAVNTSGSPSGTQTCRYAPYGAGNGTTNFNVPDYRGRVMVGNDVMDASAAGRITTTVSPGGANNGAVGGIEAKTFGVTGFVQSGTKGVGFSSGESAAPQNEIMNLQSGTTVSGSILQPSMVCGVMVKI